ncbi:MAG: hypothetical protein ACYCZV_15535 [Acidimicrobiales bacterium]
MPDEDLVRLRRSLAMVPHLSPEQIERLIDEVERLRSQRRHLAEKLDELGGRFQALLAQARNDD